VTDPLLSDEIAAAFAHPEARAKGNPPDRISLRDYVVEAEIGAFQLERGLTQRLRFNLVVELRPHDGTASDDVDLILSYDRLTEAISTELATQRLNLLESLAENIAARILSEPQPLRVFVRIEKLDRGPYALGVEIVRSRADAVPLADGTVPQPLVVFLGGSLPDLDRLAALGGPLVLCMGLAQPSTAPKASAMRIDLLEVEQNAWAAAARDARLSVVASRTEIDWAMKHGRPVLWAPSKLVLDTPGAPQAVGDGLPLAIWLADQLQAKRLLVHATVAVPADCRVPIAHF
jgi:7,8-dihydroneopterin aldolase/epimerase/oxygenase